MSMKEIFFTTYPNCFSLHDIHHANQFSTELAATDSDHLTAIFVFQSRTSEVMRTSRSISLSGKVFDKYKKHPSDEAEALVGELLTSICIHRNR